MKLNQLLLLFFIITTQSKPMEKEIEPFATETLRKIMACSDLKTQISLRCVSKALSNIHVFDLINESPLVMSRKDHLYYMVYLAKNHLIKSNYEATIKNLIRYANNCDHEDVLDLLILFEDNIKPVLDDVHAMSLAFLTMCAGGMLSTPHQEKFKNHMLEVLTQNSTKSAIKQMIKGNKADLKKLQLELPNILALIERLRSQIFSHIDASFDKIVALYRGDKDIIDQCMYAVGEIDSPDEIERYKLNPLLIAVEANSLILTELLLAQSHDLINEPNIDGLTPLLVVSNPEICKMLLACKEIQPNKRPLLGDLCGITPLYNAVDHGYKEIQNLLLAHPNFIINEEAQDIMPVCMTPLHTAAYNGNLHVFKFFFNHTHKGTVRSAIKPIHIAAAVGSSPIVKIIIDHDPTQVHVQNGQGETALHLAAASNNLMLLNFLLKRGAYINATDNDLETPLWRACKEGHIDIVEALIDHGANINASDKLNMSPLMIAIDAEHTDVAKFLIECGTDVNQQYNWINALYLAVYRKQEELVNLLMAHPKIIINPQDTSGFTPLHQAANSGHAHVFEFFLALIGGSVDNIVKPIHCAADNNQTKIIYMILNHDITQINTQDDYGNTALHAAASYGNIETVELLLKMGADREIRNKKGQTALGIACKRYHDEVVRALLKEGG